MNHPRQEAEPVDALAGSMLPHDRPRLRLPDTRRSITHKFNISGHEGYIIVGLFDDGQPGEVFLKMSKQGSTVRGLVETVGILTSVALQHGVKIEELADKFAYVRFEPSGWTQNGQIGYARSIIDYVFRWLGREFSSDYRDCHPPLSSTTAHKSDKR